MNNHSNILSVQTQTALHVGNGIDKLNNGTLPELLIITSYPPRECGIATYSQDLIKALNNKFEHSFVIHICALESENEKHEYTEKVKYILDIDQPETFLPLAKDINNNAAIRMVLVQHEFGFYRKVEAEFNQFLEALTKPIIFVFHTVLPHPGESLKTNVQKLASLSEAIIVMTNYSSKVLVRDYEINNQKITVIPHGTHLVPYSDIPLLKEKYGVSERKVLSTFGLLSSGKSIETTLNAMPAIIANHPDVMFLIIGKTHPSVRKQEGEKYRESLEARVIELGLESHVRFINKFVPLPELLEYLQLTDVYLFTSRDPNQAVSGTFSYAISCGCPVVSTPIPHAQEVLRSDVGIIIDFGNHHQLADAVNKLLNDDQLRKNISSKGLHRMAPTAWENAAIAHAILLQRIGLGEIPLRYALPPINLGHIKKLTTDFGMIQFSIINQPDLNSGYTIDDNARALVAMCQHFELTKDKTDLIYISIYFSFIKFCLGEDGHFLNYVDEQHNFTEQNDTVNLEDANGRAIWALGYLISLSGLLPETLITDAELLIQRALPELKKTHSTRAMAFIIKGLYYRNLRGVTDGVSKVNNQSNPFEVDKAITVMQKLADRLVQMYRHESRDGWKWFENYLTYANSVLPEAMLCAWAVTGEQHYKEIARTSFDFLLEKTFTEDGIKVISSKDWLDKGEHPLQPMSGEQPIDVAYTILALDKFYHVFQTDDYRNKMKIAFDWFLGNNRLHQIIYNPITGGCYDGLETDYINLNQGAESTVSYLMARVTIDPLYRSHGLEKNSNQKVESTENKTKRKGAAVPMERHLLTANPNITP